MTRNWNNFTTNSQDGGQSSPHGSSVPNKDDSDRVGYTISKDTQKEGTMPTDSLQDLGENIRVHASDPILERKSDMHGWIRIYPPSSDPAEWASHSWLLTTERDANDRSLNGVSERIKAEAVLTCFARPHFINEGHKFINPA